MSGEISVGERFDRLERDLDGCQDSHLKTDAAIWDEIEKLRTWQAKADTVISLVKLTLGTSVVGLVVGIAGLFR